MIPKSNIRQQGAALMGIVLVVFVSASTLLFSAVRPPDAIDAIDTRTYQELKAAKASLIAFAVNYASYNNDGLGPGRLPCPDAFLTSQPYWNGCNWEYVLRLPEYVPLPNGTNFHLNDYYADRDLQFWYAISSSYRWYKATFPVVNTTTGTELTIDGDPYVAVLIAAGPALEGQDREAVENSSNRYGAYENLEGDNKWWGYKTFVTADPDDPENFNDVVIGITQSELMSPITAVVVAEIKPLLDTWHEDNGDTFPTDGAEFATAMAGAPAWYARDEWDDVANYNFISAYLATVQFDDCDIVYTLTLPDPGADPDDPIPPPVSRAPNTCDP
jgi:hypothetical protein